MDVSITGKDTVRPGRPARSRPRVDPLKVEVARRSSVQANKAYADRGSMRTILGGELIRELRPK